MSNYEFEKMKLNRRKHLYLILQNIDQAFASLDNVYLKLKERVEQRVMNGISKFTGKFCKTMLFICTMIIIILSYYFYVYWNLIPRLEGSNSGFTIKFWKQKNWDDSEYRSAIIHLGLFHFFLIFGMICFIRTIFSNPGFLHDEYTDIYSIVNFLKIFFEYILNFRDPLYSMNFNTRSSKLIDDVKLILDSKKMIRRVISEYKESYLYNSLEVNMRGSELDFDDNSIDYCENSQIQARANILDGFDNFENEYMKFINSPQNSKYSHFHNIEFKEKNFSNKRFCSYCLIKKPDRTHHCRHCQRCVRRSDHHCFILTTCIGVSNYKFFFLTIFYFSIILNYMFFTSFHLISFYICEYKNSIYSIFYLTYFIFLAILTGSMTFFICYHLMFLVSNLTTIEYKEKIKENEMNNFFNLGVCFNISETFGSNCLLWLLPIDHQNETSGYSYKINEQIYEEIIKIKMTGKSPNSNTSNPNLSPSPTPV